MDHTSETIATLDTSLARLRRQGERWALRVRRSKGQRSVRSGGVRHQQNRTSCRRLRAAGVHRQKLPRDVNESLFRRLSIAKTVARRRRLPPERMPWRHDRLEATRDAHARPLRVDTSTNATSSRPPTVPVRLPVVRSDDAIRQLPGTRPRALPSTSERVVSSARPSLRRDVFAPHDSR